MDQKRWRSEFNMVKCELCGWESDENELVSHLRDEHFISYRRYYERIISSDVSDTCWKCGYSRWLIAPHLTEYLPCDACGKGCSKRIFDERRIDVLGIVKECQSSIGKNKFHQYFLATSEIDLILGGILQTGLDLLGRKKRSLKLRLDKNSIPFLDFDTGSPKEISERNLENIRIGIRDDIKVTQKGRNFLVSWGKKEYQILAPEIIDYDTKHHSRHSILNPGSKRNSKRLRLKGGSGDCIRFWGTTRRSILRLREGEVDLELRDLDWESQKIIRLVILCVKPIRDLIFEIYNELLIYCNYIYDRVFLLSHFEIPNIREFKLYISWDGLDFPKNLKETGEIIKLAII